MESVAAVRLPSLAEPIPATTVRLLAAANLGAAHVLLRLWPEPPGRAVLVFLDGPGPRDRRGRPGPPHPPPRRGRAAAGRPRRGAGHHVMIGGYPSNPGARRKGSALIVDAPSAIGTAVGRHLARDGWPVVLHYDEDDIGAEQLAMAVEEDGGHAATLQGTLTTTAAANAFFDTVEEHWGPALVLVTGAASIAAPARACALAARGGILHRRIAVRRPGAARARADARGPLRPCRAAGAERHRARRAVPCPRRARRRGRAAARPPRHHAEHRRRRA